MLNVLWRSSIGSEYVKTHDLDNVNITVEKDTEKALGQLSDIQVLVDGDPDEQLLDGEKLEHVIVPYVGVRDSLREAILERPQLKLHNSHFNDAFVAQHAVALLLACSNRLFKGDELMRAKEWQPHAANGLESVFLPGKTCLLLGYGAIAKELEPRLKGLELSLSALRRNPDKNSAIKEYGPDELHKALSEADVILISLPSTPDTKGMLDKAALTACKQNAILINVGRGDVIDQHALYDALKNGPLHSAGIDVWWNYPKEGKPTYPADAPLHELNNIVMSPHRAANYENWQTVSCEDVLKTIKSIRDGEERNQVDPEKGY